MVFIRTPTLMFWVQTTALPCFVKESLSKFIFLTSHFYFLIVTRVLTHDSLLCSNIYHMLIFILVPNMKKTCAAICGGLLKLETDNVDLPKFF